MNQIGHWIKTSRWFATYNGRPIWLIALVWFISLIITYIITLKFYTENPLMQFFYSVIISGVISLLIFYLAMTNKQ